MSAGSTSAPRRTERRGAAAESIKTAIRACILRGEIEAGQRLTISEVAQQTGYGQRPVRVAMLQLERRGVLEAAPHRGAIVRPVDARLVHDMHEVRRALDQLLVRRAVREMRADVMARLVAAQRRYENGATKRPSGPTPPLLARNAAFHAVINQAGDHPVAETIRNRGWEVVHAQGVRFGFGRDRPGQIVAGHRALAEASATGDEATALAVTDRHTVSAGNDLPTLPA